MSLHEFTLVLTSEPGEADADRLYESFDDGTISTIAGVSQIDFHREAESLEEAIRSAISEIEAAGLDVARLEMLPDALPT
jgi:hypothetical protein